MKRFATAVAVCACSLAAQTTTVPTTCTTPPSGVANLLIEHPLGLTQIQSTLQASLSPAVLAPVLAGTSEIRTRITYNPATSILQNDLFTVPVGSPVPTPANAIPARFAFITVKVDKVYLSCSVYPNVAFVGVVQAGEKLYGDPAGNPYVLSFRYTLDSTPVLQDVVSDTVGLSMTFEPKAPAGATLTFATTTAAVTGAPTIQTIYRQIVLDGTSSQTNVGSGALTYKWSAVGTGVAILDQGVGQTRVQIAGLEGDYPVTLTVTDAAGNQASTTVIVRFSGR